MTNSCLEVHFTFTQSPARPERRASKGNQIPPSWPIIRPQGRKTAGKTGRARTDGPSRSASSMTRVSHMTRNLLFVGTDVGRVRPAVEEMAAAQAFLA